jgi:hypothetical protein
MRGEAKIHHEVTKDTKKSRMFMEAGRAALGGQAERDAG